MVHKIQEVQQNKICVFSCFLCFVDRLCPYSLTNNPTWCTVLFKYIYLFLFSTCFGHPRAHHQEKIIVTMRHWYLSLSMGDDGHWDARNM